MIAVVLLALSQLGQPNSGGGPILGSGIVFQVVQLVVGGGVVAGLFALIRARWGWRARRENSLQARVDALEKALNDKNNAALAEKVTLEMEKLDLLREKNALEIKLENTVAAYERQLTDLKNKVSELEEEVAKLKRENGK